MTLAELQAFARDVQQQFDNMDLAGKRFTGAGEPVSQFDFVRKADLDKAVSDVRSEIVTAVDRRSALGVDVYGDFLITGNFKSRSDTGSIVTIDHVATSARTFTLPDATGNGVYETAALTNNNFLFGGGGALVKDAGFSTVPVGNGGTGVTAPAGTYTPTLTNVNNVAASTAYACQYLRVGATVIVSGKIDVDPTAAGQCQLGISLPIASNLALPQQCAGAAAAPGIAGQSAAIGGDATNDRAEMVWIAVDTSNQAMYFVFVYQVI